MAQQDTWNVTVIEGDRWDGAVVTVTVNAVLSDLTGLTIEMAIRYPGRTDNALLLSTATGDITLSDPANGEFTIDPMTVSLPVGEYRHAITISYASGPKTYVKGDFIVRQKDVENE